MTGAPPRLRRAAAPFGEVVRDRPREPCPSSQGTSVQPFASRAPPRASRTLRIGARGSSRPCRGLSLCSEPLHCVAGARKVATKGPGHPCRPSWNMTSGELLATKSSLPTSGRELLASGGGALVTTSRPLWSLPPPQRSRALSFVASCQDLATLAGKFATNDLCVAMKSPRLATNRERHATMTSGGATKSLHLATKSRSPVLCPRQSATGRRDPVAKTWSVEAKGGDLFMKEQSARVGPVHVVTNGIESATFRRGVAT